MPKPQTAAERVIGNSGFSSVTVFLPLSCQPQKAATERLDVALLERSQSALLIKKLLMVH